MLFLSYQVGTLGSGESVPQEWVLQKRSAVEDSDEVASGLQRVPLLWEVLIHSRGPQSSCVIRSWPVEG